MDLARIRRSLPIACLTVGLAAAFCGIFLLLRNLAPHPVPAAVHIFVFVFFFWLAVLLFRHLVLLFFSFLNLLKRSPDKLPALPLVTVIVPAFNEGIPIQAVIKSLTRLDYPNLEIIIVDDGSTDDTASKAAAYAGLHGTTQVRVLQKKQGGKAQALNTGLRAANGDLILCVDGDSALSSDCLRRAVHHFSDPSVGAVAGNVKVVNRSNILTRLQALEYVEGLNFVRSAQAYFGVVSIVPGPVGLFRRSALLEAGGYSSDTFAEDCDLTLRFLARGWRVAYEPRAIAYTEAPEHVLDLVRQRYRWTRGILQAMRKQESSFLNPRARLATSISFLNMGFEGILWPVMNVAAHVLFVVIALSHGLPALLLIWCAQLMLLDLSIGLYCVLVEGESLALVPYAVLYRLFFALKIDVVKICSMWEEFLSLQMDWGKLKRLGRI